jgi:hypothetical protein
MGVFGAWKILVQQFNTPMIPPRLMCFVQFHLRKCTDHFSLPGSVNGFAYLYMLQLRLLPQLQEDSDNFILQQDGASPHFHLEVRRHLNTTSPQHWIGHTSRCNKDSALIPWPPRSLNLTPCEFFLWDYVKDKVYAPPLPRDLPELRQRIVVAVEATDVDMLQCVWQELDYRIDVCQVTRGGHMEHLYGRLKT